MQFGAGVGILRFLYWESGGILRYLNPLMKNLFAADPSSMQLFSNRHEEHFEAQVRNPFLLFLPHHALKFMVVLLCQGYNPSSIFSPEICTPTSFPRHRGPYVLPRNPILLTYKPLFPQIQLPSGIPLRLQTKHLTAANNTSRKLNHLATQLPTRYTRTPIRINQNAPTLTRTLNKQPQVITQT